MFNIKDTPAATGYMIFSLGLVALIDTRYFSDRRIRALAGGGIALGLFVAIGTRTALALPLILTLPFTVLVSWLLLTRSGTARRDVRLGRRSLEGLGAYVAAYLALVLVYPKAFLNPIEVGIKSILDSALYPVNEAQLVNGEWLVQPVSWLYQPLWFGAQLPLLVLAGLIGFIIWWLVRVLRVLALGEASSGGTITWLTQSVPLLLQISIVPVAAVVGQSTLYNGTRQMLFVPPAAAVLATLAVSRLAGWRRVSASRPLRSAIWVAVALGMIAPITAQVQLFPYGYTFVNAVTAIRPVDGNWPSDYWRASGRELLRVLPAQGADSCGLEQLQKGELVPCTEQPMFLPYLDERGTDATPVALAPTEYWFIRENSGVLDLPPGCRPFTEVTRSLFWQTVTIGQIAICDSRVDTGKRNMADPALPAPV